MLALKSPASTHSPLQLDRTGPSPLSLKLGLSGHYTGIDEADDDAVAGVSVPPGSESGVEAEEARRPRRHVMEQPVLVHAGHALSTRHASSLVAGELDGEAVHDGVVGVQDAAEVVGHGTR